MRKGRRPTDACFEAMGRVARNYSNDKKKLSTFQLKFFALNKDGEYGSVALWKTPKPGEKISQFAVHDGTEARLQLCKTFFDEIGHEE
jgi:hypothetical protein